MLALKLLRALHHHVAVQSQTQSLSRIETEAMTRKSNLNRQDGLKPVALCVL